MEARHVAVGRQTYTGSSEACMLGGVAIGVEYILGRFTTVYRELSLAAPMG
jgi:hypothetical protein